MYSIAKNIQIVIATLKAHNISQLVLSPGGTNAPFIRNVQDDDFFKCYSVVDERSALYFAIGIYLETGKPVAVCCTSAQATRNYLPGLTEAYYKHVPILAITFSKHYRFVGQDYMQAPNQTSLPEDAVRKTYALPYVANEQDFMHCARLANEAMLDLIHRVPAPIQLNVPMLDTELGKDVEENLPEVKIINRYYKEDVADVNIADKRILIVVGENRGINDRTIIQFAKTHNAAIYVNHLSNMRNDFTVDGNLLLTILSQSDFDESLAPDILITIGGQTGDYPLYHKLAESNCKYEHWRICPSGDIVDTYDHLTRVYECSYDEFFNGVKDSSNTNEYLSAWVNSISKLNSDVDIPLSNMYTALILHGLIPENSIVNFAILNSLRVWNLYPIKNKVRCFSNVGAFGIDGGLSTFFGQSVMTDELCFMVTGDLAFFYDMNSLGIRHIKNNVRIILVNNNGGIEFKYGVGPERAKESDKYIAAANHFKNTEGWATVNEFEYHAVKTKKDFDDVVNSLVSQSDKPILIEVMTTDENESNAMMVLRKANDTRTLSTKIASRLKRFF